MGSDVSTRPPHILLANVFFAPFSYGGATVVAEEVARALVRNNTARISAVSLIARAELAPYTIIRSKVGEIDNYLINMPAGRTTREFWDNPKVEDVIQRLIERLSPDLVHVHCIQEIGIGIMRAAEKAGLPTILSIHDFWWICERQFMVRMDNVYCAQNPVRIEACKGCVDDWNHAQTRFYSLQQAADLANIVTYPSQFARDLCEASGLAPGKGIVWKNGVHLPHADFFKTQAARRARDPRLVFGFVGGPSQIKGWPTIRNAFKRLPRTDFRVDLVEGSSDNGWWRNHTFNDLPGEWRIVPRYSQSDMDRFYAEIDVLLFMSQWKETFGLAIREALSRGIEVIQTDSGGTTEHLAVDEDALIPIGAGPDKLASQLEAKLSRGRIEAPTFPVDSFQDQAAAFEQLIQKALQSDGVNKPL